MTLTYSRHPAWDVINDGNPYTPFDWQARHIHARPDTRFIIAACGRRSGKTTAITAEVDRECLRPTEIVLGKKQAPLIYVIGPTAELSQKIWTPIWDQFVPDDRGEQTPPMFKFYRTHDKTRRIIWLKNGAVIQGKSADDPKSLQGDRVTCAVVDESHSMPDEAWQYLLPSLLDSGGRLLAIGVSKGKNRFRSMWEHGQGGEDDYYSFSVPSTAHPNIFATDEEAETARAQGNKHAQSLESDEGFLSLSETEQKQQYFAEWVEDDGSVFSQAAIDGALTGSWEDPRDDGLYVAGLDIGKVNSYTVMYIGDLRTQRVVARERFVGVDYTVQLPRIAAMLDRYKCRAVHMDTTGGGIPTRDFLRAELEGSGCAIVDFSFGTKSKEEIMMTLQREMERGNVTLPRDDTELRRELELFESISMPGGSVRYQAPPGYRDDCVDSVALLVTLMYRRKGMTKSPNRKPYVSFSSDSQSKRAEMPSLPMPKEEAVA